jgi:putative transposase
MIERSSQIQELKSLSKATKDVRMKMRYDVVRLNLEGRSRKEIAEISNITYNTVSKYINIYEKLGAAGLIMRKSPGRNRKLTEDQERQLYDCISKRLPREVGFAPFANWTAPLACKWVEKEFGVAFTERGMRNLFDRLKLSYTRPTYVLKKANPVAQTAFIETFEELKKTNIGCYRPSFI